MRIATEPVEACESRILRRELARDLRRRYGGDPESVELGPEDGVEAFYVARSPASAAALGCVLLRRYGDGVFELRRMYVRPAARGRGVALALLAAAEAGARKRGGRRLVLECGTAQPEAMALYERAGYERIPAFGVYAGSPRQRCFGRDLSAVSPGPGPLVWSPA